MTPFDPLPPFALVELVELFRLHGESDFDLLERIAVGQAYIEHRGVQTQMADHLGITHAAMNRLMERYHARPKDTEAA